jgi:PAS domain S-box-containing protein
MLVFFSGILISLLLWMLFLALFNTSSNAHKIADKLTRKLKESEEHLREVLENSRDAAYKRNLLTGKYEYLSPVFLKISGYTPEEMEHLPLETVIGFMHPDDLKRVEIEISAFLSDKTCRTNQLEYRFKHKKGEYCWLQDRFTIVRDEDGNPLALIGSVSNIDDRKQVAEALQNERLLLRTVIDNIPDSIYCMDTECRKTLANLTDLSYMGAKSEAEVIGKSDADFYPDELAEAFMATDRSVIQTGKPVLNWEESLVDGNGDKKWLLSSKLPMLNKNGEITGLIGIGRDITDRKHAEEEIKLKNEELKKANGEKDKFFSIIAHDLRSPFNGFLGLTQMMAEDLPTLSMTEIRDISLMLKKSATNLFRLLENLLEWAKVQQGLIPFNPQPGNIHIIMNEILELIGDSSKAKGIGISCNIDADIEVIADINMFQTVIRNLVSNATKFTNRGGMISLAARLIRNNFVEISVTDNGIGMSSETVDGLFRLDVNTSSKGTEGESSTGLGLIICKEFIEKHGGTLWVTSEVGEGSTFYFTIPGRIVREESNMLQI